MPKKRKATSDAVEILRRRYYKGKPQRLADLEEARAEDELARKIYELSRIHAVRQGDLNAKAQGCKDFGELTRVGAKKKLALPIPVTRR
jgi:hypothetical protein